MFCSSLQKAFLSHGVPSGSGAGHTGTYETHSQHTIRIRQTAQLDRDAWGCASVCTALAEPGRLVKGLPLSTYTGKSFDIAPNSESRIQTCPAAGLYKILRGLDHHLSARMKTARPASHLLCSSWCLLSAGSSLLRSPHTWSIGFKLQQKKQCLCPCCCFQLQLHCPPLAVTEARHIQPPCLCSAWK